MFSKQCQYQHEPFKVKYMYRENKTKKLSLSMYVTFLINMR